MASATLSLTTATTALLVLAGVTAPSCEAAISDNEVSPQAFHQRLAPYGHWFQHPRWGEVWHPTEVPADFRPYRDGHWEGTQDYGTVWVSDYSAAADERGHWGDIVFHYGRWVSDPQYGWLWVPGYTWSPAWVVWRQGGGNIGWLPMPPGEYDGVGDYPDDWAGWYGYRGWYGAALTDAAFFAMWSFVPAYDIYAPEVAVDVIAPGGYVGFIGRTAPWTRFEVVNGHVVSRAIDSVRFRAAFGRELPISARNEFLAHHGPIIGLERSRRLELGHGYMHAGYPAGVHTGVVHHGVGMEHNTIHGPYSHGESQYAHPETAHIYYGEHSERPNYEHSNMGGYGQHSMNGTGTPHPMNGMGAYTQHPMNGGNPAGGVQHSPTPQTNQRRPH